MGLYIWHALLVQSVQMSIMRARAELTLRFESFASLSVCSECCIKFHVARSARMFHAQLSGSSFLCLMKCTPPAAIASSERANERNSERVTLFWLQLFNKSISPQMHGLGIFQQ